MFAFYKDEMYRDTPTSRPQVFFFFFSFNVINLTSVLPSLPMKNPVLDTDIITPLLYPRLSVQQAQNNHFISTTTTITILSMDSQILVF